METRKLKNPLTAKSWTESGLQLTHTQEGGARNETDEACNAVFSNGKEMALTPDPLNDVPGKGIESKLNWE